MPAIACCRRSSPTFRCRRRQVGGLVRGPQGAMHFGALRQGHRGLRPIHPARHKLPIGGTCFGSYSLSPSNETQEVRGERIGFDGNALRRLVVSAAIPKVSAESRRLTRLVAFAMLGIAFGSAPTYLSKPVCRATALHRWWGVDSHDALVCIAP